jgi:hypothetical protein
MYIEFEAVEGGVEELSSALVKFLGRRQASVITAVRAYPIPQCQPLLLDDDNYHGRWWHFSFIVDLFSVQCPAAKKLFTSAMHNWSVIAVLALTLVTDVGITYRTACR